ncbi:peptidase S8/S53 domain-containing protein [Rhodofomes roseus]|uniref:Peptidase S8/S53 domain-containing protein n=1 Tax=Rhodofomes roseus TaxID=34475 RepID=A0ABQ8K8I4_9APHY|nr:peptidase S8/S53 domain-containing protein [Rhodofomes roseus]KAH9833503.1 peptidase S8/S53 domain-containing protein [Rhodofomes roseus]
MDIPPQVVLTNHGDNEKSPLSICNAYAQLGARGVPILYASGDGGVSGNKASDNRTEFVPVFPASCPYVTTPAYQSAAVASYLSALGSNSSGLLNATGRAYPDVSAYGTQYDIESGAAALAVSGMSCSTPTFAAVAVLLNESVQRGQERTPREQPACNGGTPGFHATQGWIPVTGLGTPNFTLLASAASL